LIRLVNPRAILGVTLVAVLAGCGAGSSPSSLPATGLQPVGLAQVHATEKVLYSFADGVDGAGVILDKSGNILGTGSTGGSFTCSIGCGVVYELGNGSGWTESVLAYL
jgi:hypothetical protein